MVVVAVVNNSQDSQGFWVCFADESESCISRSGVSQTRQTLQLNCGKQQKYAARSEAGLWVMFWGRFESQLCMLYARVRVDVWGCVKYSMIPYVMFGGVARLGKECVGISGCLRIR